MLKQSFWMPGKTWVPTSQPLLNLISSELVSVISLYQGSSPPLSQGPLYYQPKQCIVRRDIYQNCHTFALFDPPKWVISWPLLYSYKNLELKMTACHMGHSSKSFTNRPSTASSTESCKMESCWPTSLTQPFFFGGGKVQVSHGQKTRGPLLSMKYKFV